MKRIAATLMAGALIALLPPLSASAGETVYRFDPATQTSRAMVFKNLWAGYNTFRNSCKSCHYRGNDKGAKFLYEDSRTMRGWNKVFYKKNVKCAKAGDWDSLSQEELVALNDYLYSKAYDTWNPNDAKSCG